MKSSPGDPMLDAMTSQSEARQLLVREHSVLFAREGPGAFGRGARRSLS
jgi:hypothetical protein